MTGFWREAIMMFLIGALFYNRKRCGGGDVKLMAMTGAFVGIWVLPAFIISRISIWLYRIIKKDNKVIPYAPFLMGASIPFIFIM
jgi:prepilin signal peptidase PulO-like enzyme (type II secretory pathway)